MCLISPHILVSYFLNPVYYVNKLLDTTVYYVNKLLDTWITMNASTAGHSTVVSYKPCKQAIY